MGKTKKDSYGITQLDSHFQTLETLLFIDLDTSTSIQREFLVTEYWLLNRLTHIDGTMLTSWLHVPDPYRWSV